MIDLTVPAVAARDAHYTERHRSADLSVGVYEISVGVSDPQSPHTEDEVYVVLAGRARLVGPEASISVGAGSVVFVAAGEEHRFVDVEERLRVAVVFGPAEHSRRGVEDQSIGPR
jgi:mannose-6-phosphate isomerase-like protein (cupin superfamily)